MNPNDGREKNPAMAGWLHDHAARDRWRRAWRMLRVAGLGFSEFQLCDRCKQLAKAAEWSFAARTRRLYYHGEYDPDIAVELRRYQCVRVWRAGSRLYINCQQTKETDQASNNRGDN